MDLVLLWTSTILKLYLVRLIRQGRYAYGKQPFIGAWNLARFAEALLPLLDENQEKAIEIAEREIAHFSNAYHQNWFAGMRAKIGLMNEEQEDEGLITDLLQFMQQYKADYTNTFRALTLNQLQGENMFNKEDFKEWHQRWQERLKRQGKPMDTVMKWMKSHNPAIIPRNHRVEEALAAAEEGDTTVMIQLLDVLSDPFAYTKDQETYSQLPAPSNQCYQTFCGT